MANKFKEVNKPFFEEISKIFRNRLKEMNVTKYTFCLRNGFNRNTCERILKAQCSFSLNTLIEYLDAAGLEIKIIRKETQQKSQSNEHNN